MCVETCFEKAQGLKLPPELLGAANPVLQGFAFVLCTLTPREIWKRRWAYTGFALGKIQMMLLRHVRTEHNCGSPCTRVPKVLLVASPPGTWCLLRRAAPAPGSVGVSVPLPQLAACLHWTAARGVSVAFHQQGHHQQRPCPAVLSAAQATPGIVCPVLVPAVQKRCGHAGEVTKMIQGPGSCHVSKG